MEKQDFNTQIEIEVGFDPQPMGLTFDEYSTHHNILYNIELDLKDWGIKSILLYAPAQKLEFYLNMYQSDLDESSFPVKFIIDVQKIEIDKSDANFVSSIQPKKMELKLSELSVDMTDTPTVRGMATGNLIF